MRKILSLTVLMMCLWQTTSIAQPGFNRIYDASSIGNKQFHKILVDQDTVIALGVGYETNTPQGIALAKLDSSGNLLAQNFILDSLGDFLSTDFLWGDFFKTSQGHYAFPAVALNRGSYLLIQIDKNLAVKSIFEFGTPQGTSTPFDEAIVQLDDGGFFICGHISRQNQKRDGFVRRVDKNGNVLWFKYYGDYTKEEMFTCIARVSNNRFVLGGGLGPNATDPYALRAGLWAIDSNGTVTDTWVGPQDPNLIILRGMLPRPEGGFIAHGRTYWGEGDWGSKVQVSLAGFDADLQMQWLRHIGPSSSNYNGAYDMMRTADGHYLLAGERTAYGDLSEPSGGDWGGWLHKFNSVGDSLWSRADNAPDGLVPTGAYTYGGLGALSSGSIVAGGRGDIENKFTGWVVKVTADGCLDTLFCQGQSAVGEVPVGQGSLRPNPSSGEVEWVFPAPAAPGTVLCVYDLWGRRVLELDVSVGSASHRLWLSALPNGCYILHTTVQGRITGRQRLVLAR